MIDLLQNLLAPIARLLVARGVLFPEFVEAMKGQYLAAAHARARAEDHKATDSRLALLTGLQRRDIKRLKDTPEARPKPAALSRLVSLWQTDPRFSQQGVPLPLPRTAPEPSFDTLAREIRRDVHSRTLLDSLVDAGTVRVEGGIVTLEHRSYQPLAGSEDQIAYLAANAGDHLMAAVDNVLDQPRHFERAVHYERLTAEQVAELDAEYRKAQMEILQTLSQKAAAMKKQETGVHRFRAGGYTFHTARAPKEGERP